MIQTAQGKFYSSSVGLQIMIIFIIDLSVDNFHN